MIKVNVELNNQSWHRKIKNPEKYFRSKLKNIPKIINFDISLYHFYSFGRLQQFWLLMDASSHLGDQNL